MKNNIWETRIGQMMKIMKKTCFTNTSGVNIGGQEGFKKWEKLTLLNKQKRGVIYLIGNGASASMASHFSADLAKNARLHTQVFSDLSLITAISNDMGYEQVFVEPLRRRAAPNDMLVAISSSGKSKNILRAAEFARTHGMQVVTLSGMSEKNPLRTLGALNIYVPGTTYGIIETCHAAILHFWMDLVAGHEQLEAFRQPD